MMGHEGLNRVNGTKDRKGLRDAQMYVSYHHIHAVEETAPRSVLTMMIVSFFLCLPVSGGGQEVGNSRQRISPRIGLYCVHFHHLFLPRLIRSFWCVCVFIHF